MTANNNRTPHLPPAAETAQIAHAAGVVALGNAAGRVLGLAREAVKSYYFGAGGTVDALNVALRVPILLYDLLIGSMINSALVPVFADYKTKAQDELWSLVSTLLGLTTIALAGCVLLITLFAPQVAGLLSGGSSPEVLALTARLLRITTPALLFLALSGVLAGLLYAFRRFAYPAFAAATLNAGIVAVTLALHARLGSAAMALGLLAGAILQLALQLIGLRDARLRLRLVLRHPGLRRVVVLYTPIILGLLLDILLSRPLTYNLASRTGPGGISWMEYALSLSQLPQGLVALGVSFAVLPTLAAHATHERGGGPPGPYRATLAQGLRLVIVLIIPAAAGLFILARPTVILLLEHGGFTTFDTQITVQALRLYLLSLPFSAIDLLLVYAFYARQDTLTPALIGVVVTLVYMALAVALLPVLGLFGLMVAEGIKLLLHATISAAILARRLGGFGQHGIGTILVKTLLATALMGFATVSTASIITGWLPGSGLLAEVVAVVIPGVVGVATWLAFATLLKIEELGLLWSMSK